MAEAAGRGKPKWRLRVAAVACWTATMALGFVGLVYARDTVLAVAAVAEAGRPMTALVDKVLFFVLGAAGLVVLLTAEPYYQRGAAAGRLTERFLRVTGAQLALLFVACAVVFLLPGLADGVRPGALFVVVAGLLGGACIWGARWMARRR